MKALLTVILAVGIGYFVINKKPAAKLPIVTKKEEVTRTLPEKKQVSPVEVKKQPEVVKPVLKESVQTVVSKSCQYNDELEKWLHEADFRIMSEDVAGLTSEVQPNGHTVYSGRTQDGQGYQAETDENGELVAEEIQFADGRKLSKLYESGKIKALFFQQTKEFAFSASYDEFGRQTEFVLLKNGVREKTASF